MKTEVMTNVAYLGPEGSFSHIAAFLHVAGRDEELGGLLKPMKSIREVFEAVENGDCRFGLVPYENSLAGNIAETLEAFDTFMGCIHGEVYVPVNHVLMTAAPDESEIERIYSKYEVFGQCHKWLQKNMPNAEQVPVASTSHAACLAKHDKQGAAIGSTLAAKHFKLSILEYELGDGVDNFTRFLVLGSNIRQRPKEGEPKNDKTTMRFVVPHAAGELVRVLNIFCQVDVNLTHLALLPKALSPMSRVFFVDFEGDAIERIDMVHALTKNGVAFKFLGSYPKAEDLL